MKRSEQLTAAKVVIKESDKPFLNLMKFRSPNQLRVLMAVAVNPSASQDQLAADLNIPKGTVKSRLNRARAQLLKLRAAAVAGEGVPNEQALGSIEGN